MKIKIPDASPRVCKMECRAPSDIRKHVLYLSLIAGALACLTLLLLLFRACWYNPRPAVYALRPLGLYFCLSMLASLFMLVRAYMVDVILPSRLKTSPDSAAISAQPNDLFFEIPLIGGLARRFAGITTDSPTPRD